MKVLRHLQVAVSMLTSSLIIAGVLTSMPASHLYQSVTLSLQKGRPSQQVAPHVPQERRICQTRRKAQVSAAVSCCACVELMSSLVVYMC